MLGVFLLPAFTRLGHERQALLSPRDGTHVCTDLGLYFHPKEFLGSGVGTHVYSKGKILSIGGIEEDRTREPNTLPTELFWPQSGDRSSGLPLWRRALCHRATEVTQQKTKQKQNKQRNGGWEGAGGGGGGWGEGVRRGRA